MPLILPTGKHSQLSSKLCTTSSLPHLKTTTKTVMKRNSYSFGVDNFWLTYSNVRGVLQDEEKSRYKSLLGSHTHLKSCDSHVKNRPKMRNVERFRPWRIMLAYLLSKRKIITPMQSYMNSFMMNLFKQTSKTSTHVLYPH